MSATDFVSMTPEDVAALAQSFYHDSASICREALTMAGYKLPKCDGPDQIVIHYFNVLKRYIEPKRRRVWYSREFACTSDQKVAVRSLAKRFEEGQDVNSHQSKRLKKAQFKDFLLNDWGIHHLHLVMPAQGTRSVKDSGSLLFARIDSTDVYLLMVGAHGDWTKQELVRILHRNWPDAIAQYRLRGIVGGPRPMTDQEIGVLRQRGYATLLQMPDRTIYIGPGSGCATDGTSTDVAMKRHQLVRMCWRFAELVREHIHVLKTQCENGRVEFRPPYRFKLYSINGHAYAWEETYNAVIDLSTPLPLRSMSVPQFGRIIARPQVRQ